jgi:acetyl-CoA carboxylase biotin carboxyl carrier protein
VNIDLDQIRSLLAVVSSTDITELTIEFGDHKITVKKAPSTQNIVVAEQPVAAHVPNRPVTQMSFEPKPKEEPAEAATTESPTATNGLVPVTSPMVGTFYRATSPTAAPFVNVGDHINVGQTVCIIEAMKLMNDMPSEVSGKIVKVCVDNGTTVEYGQQLFLVDPKG